MLTFSAKICLLWVISASDGIIKMPYPGAKRKNPQGPAA